MRIWQGGGDTAPNPTLTLSRVWSDGKSRLHARLRSGHFGGNPCFSSLPYPWKSHVVFRGQWQGHGEVGARARGGEESSGEHEEGGAG